MLFSYRYKPISFLFLSSLLACLHFLHLASTTVLTNLFYLCKFFSSKLSWLPQYNTLLFTPLMFSYSPYLLIYLSPSFFLQGVHVSKLPFFSNSYTKLTFSSQFTSFSFINLLLLPKIFARIILVSSSYHPLTLITDFSSHNCRFNSFAFSPPASKLSVSYFIIMHSSALTFGYWSFAHAQFEKCLTPKNNILNCMIVFTIKTSAALSESFHNFFSYGRYNAEKLLSVARRYGHTS